MRHKEPHFEIQWRAAPAKLREIAEYMDELMRETFGKELVITRIRDAVAGESGVHQEGRAFDARIQWFDDEGTAHLEFDKAQREYICKCVNAKFKRVDGFPTCIAHAFRGGPMHFHVQIPKKWALDEN